VGCERSERQETGPIVMCLLLSEVMSTFGCTLKYKQPHPSPPLLPQGRERMLASTNPREK